MNKKLIFLMLISLIIFQACEKDEIDPGNEGGEETTINWAAAADSSSSSFIYSYWNPAEAYFQYNNLDNTDFHYWPQAHALDVVIDAYDRTGDNLYLTTINDWYEGVKAKNGNSFFNVYYDDMEWNALAMLRAYNATNQERYKTAAISVWEDIQTGWNDNAGGGISWKKDQPYSKNACSNGPACILAARLYQQFGDDSDKEWALKIYDWEKEYLFNPASGAVYDNINSRTGEIQQAWIFTYNQGTFLGSALELYNITGSKTYLNDAQKAADHTLNALVNSADRLLKDEGAGDGGLFKGIFVRYFTQLILHPDLSDGTRNRYLQFLKYNAEKLWQEGTDKNKLLYGTYWKNKPGSTSDLTTQTSGAMLIEAAALLEAEGLITP
ncbi:glycoside hydrolase family 76 protein [uncultured Draconibacterium sp.]|uniref:glycoside hydrolase family 76 protein n=1 Tax=uncultured Draconibacterium sp. TaxID=1573823 RepID=UPI0029C7D5FA|nr:glycoside hydrolase family 76 protein [uncultured Draconibacterium sp.]